MTVAVGSKPRVLHSQTTLGYTQGALWMNMAVEWQFWSEKMP